MFWDIILLFFAFAGASILKRKYGIHLPFLTNGKSTQSPYPRQSFHSPDNNYSIPDSWED